MIEFYTDGSATKSRSGWGVIGIHYGEEIMRLQGTEPNATNQRMELRAAYEALKFWSEYEPSAVCVIYSDSAYLVNCYNDKWYINWENNGWINSKKEPVANKELWELLIPFFKNPYVSIEKVKGHSGHTYNEIADKLATGAIIIDKNDHELKIDEINDKINIELSEILLDYSMKKYPVDETIKRIRKACNCG